MQTHSDGIRIHFEVHGQGEPVLLVTGWTISSAVFDPVADLYLPHVRVIAYDPQQVPEALRHRIVELEAYIGQEDAACHARFGPTDRASGRVPRQDFRPSQHQGSGTPIGAGAGILRRHHGNRAGAGKHRHTRPTGQLDQRPTVQRHGHGFHPSRCWSSAPEARPRVAARQCDDARFPADADRGDAGSAQASGRLDEAGECSGGRAGARA